MFFVCPKCKEKLNMQGNSAVCALGHSYDRSKKGYFNLLLGRVGGTHGDNREMLEARRLFLEGGYYKPLAEAVASAVCEYTPTCGAVLDIGCGEGYYTDHIERALSARDGKSFVAGFDISKDATAMTHKRNSRVECAVAGAYDMPVEDGAVNTAVNMFSPLAANEILRCLKPDGAFVMAIPAENHLFGLKSLLYDTPYRNTVADTAIEGFELVSDRSISYEITLDKNESILALFGMTPYAYRTGKAGRERIEAVATLTTEVDFRLFVYKKL